MSNTGHIFDTYRQKIDSFGMAAHPNESQEGTEEL